MYNKNLEGNYLYFDLKAKVRELSTRRKEDAEADKSNIEKLRTSKNSMRDALQKQMNDIKSDLSEKIKENDQKAMKRIDKTQQEQKEYKDKTDEEFKTINSSMSEIKQETATINGKLDTLLSKI